MFSEFVKVVAPIVAVGFYMCILAPDLLKLIPIIFVSGVVWSTFQVAKGFATGDARRESDNW